MTCFAWGLVGVLPLGGTRLDPARQDKLFDRGDETDAGLPCVGIEVSALAQVT